MQQLGDLKGVGRVTVERLKASGMDDPLMVLAHGVAEVKEAAQCDEAGALMILARCREAVEESGIMGQTIMSASDVLKEREAAVRIKSGSDKLDGFLGGGLERKAMTEVWGEFGSGKTQFAHMYAALAQRPVEEGGLGLGVIYIDAENTFRPERIGEMAEARGMDPKATVDGITVMRALNAGHMKMLLEETVRRVRDGGVGLVVVDSITKHYRAEYGGQGWLARRQQAMGSFLHTLNTAAQLHNVAVILTNQVVAKPGVMYGPTEVAVGGNVLGHASTYRIQIRKNAKTKRVLKMDDSPGSAQAEIVMHLSAAGLVEEEPK